MKTTDFKNKKVMVFGWARSGKAAAKRLLELGAYVTVVNGGDFDTQDATYRELLAADVDLVNTDQPDILDNTYDYLIKNPGINYEHALVRKATKLNIPILTEVEVALSSFEGRLIVVTGSNGKTTTTSLIRDMLSADGQKVTTAGNIGIPVSEVVAELTKEDTLLLELSSFQLLGLPDIQPDIALITNIFTNHLDYHKTRENYVAAKFRVTRNQTPNQYLVLNADGEDTEAFKLQTNARVVEFSRTKKGFSVEFIDDTLMVAENRVMLTKDIQLVGPHNQENILAAVTVAKLANVSIEAVQEVLKTFSGVEHRLQYLFTVNDVKYFNDSKATDIEATQTALNSFDSPTIWIGGGLDRGDNLNRLLPNLKNVKAVIAIGETQQKVVALARDAEKPVIAVTDVTQAAPIATQLASPGDVVLLSPAHASWDQYSSFEERGNQYVQALREVLKLRKD